MKIINYIIFTKVLILLILLSLLIFTKNNPQNKLFLYEHVFNKNLSLEVLIILS